MSAAQVPAPPRVVIEIADSGKTIEGQGPNRSRFKVNLVGGGTYYWTPAEAGAIFQALGEVLEPLETA